MEKLVWFLSRLKAFARESISRNPLFLTTLLTGLSLTLQKLWNWKPASINPLGCTEAEAVAIRNLAAVYCGAYITGGTSNGLSFRVGDLSVDESQSANVSNANLQFLLDQAKAVIARLNVADFRAVNA